MTGPLPRVPRWPTVRQVAALLELRWRMVRRPWARAGLLTLAAALPAAFAVAVAAGVALRAEADALAPGSAGQGVAVPALFASMAVLAATAPLAAGGAHELYPAEHLVAFPLRPPTLVASSVLLSPLNLAWLTQALGIAGAAGYLAGGGPGLGPAVALTCVYVVFATVVGQAVAWLVTGVRQTRGGRLAVAAVAGGAIGGALTAWRRGGGAALEALPTTRVAELVERVGAGNGSWLPGALLLAVGAAAAGRGAVAACAWTLRRGPDVPAEREARQLRRRTSRRSVLAELTAVDRASVARSAPLRRGVIVLAALPGLAMALPSVEWASIVMLPGLVSAGAGLLFGVNVFCLDGSGALWLASLPHDPRLAYLAKARVLAEVCVGTSLVAVVIAVLRAPADPTAAQVLAVVGASVACPAAVVASCMSMSVRHPHRADMRTARDTPAPPGSMVVHALRLSVVATVTGGLMALFSYADRPWVPVVGAVALTLRPAAAVARSADGWRARQPRAGVVAAVSAG